MQDQRREPELREAADFEVGPADLTGQDRALPEVTFGVRGVRQAECPRRLLHRDLDEVPRSVPHVLDGPPIG